MTPIKELWTEFKTSIIKYMPDLVSALVIAVVGIVIAIFAVRIARKAMAHRKVDPSLSAFICKAVRILIYVFTLLAAMSALKISTTGLIAFFSAAAAAVALALKDKLSDIASGIVILFTKPFVTGDFIEFGSRSGFVEKIDVMHTNLRTYDGTNIIVPNSVISSSEVNNYTAQPQTRVTVHVPIPYDADVQKVKAVLLKTLLTQENILTDEAHKPGVCLDKYEESSLDFVARCYVNFKDYWSVYHSLTERIKSALDENGITIPFNQLDVHLIK